MLISTLFSFAATLLSAAAYGFARLPALLSAAITFGTVFYHLAMRLAVGYAIDSIFHNRLNYKMKWFREKRFEPKLYACIGVKKWKGRFPTFRPDDFNMKKHSVTELAQASCQSELVHELIVLFSFVPVLFSKVFGAAMVFCITSIFAALFDCCFIVIQRCNRPRLLRLAERRGE